MTMNRRTATLGFQPVGSSPEELAAKIKSGGEKWSRVVREPNIRID
jgi:tripartite-type tricarboxylate transporter receptor subunit TctC